MSLPPGISAEQLQQLLATLKETIEASADLAGRVEALEQTIVEIRSGLVGIREGLQTYFDSYKAQTEMQMKLHSDTVASIGRLEARIEALEPPRRIM
jgi:uncharacterized coiled-coil DUF342 family protein